MKVSQRNFGLDVLRAVSIWLVLFQHGGIPIVEGLQGLKIGGVGVEVFFVLSGFLIGQILIRNLQKENSFKSIKTFWIRRWFRILPLYYLMLLIKMIFFDPSIGSNILYYVFFLQNNFYGIEFYEVTWSLVIEEWFYITVPLFMYITFKISKENVKIVLLFFALFILFEHAIRFFYVQHSNVPYGGVNGNVVFRLDALFWGVLFAYIKMQINWVYQKLIKIYVFLIAMTCFIGYIAYIKMVSGTPEGIDGTLFPRTFGFGIFPIIIAFLLPFVDSRSKFTVNTVPRKIIYNFITYTSLFTYAIYLVHPLVFSYLITENILEQANWVNFILAVGSSYVIASILYNYFENPILKIRDKYFSERKTMKA